MITLNRLVNFHPSILLLLAFFLNVSSVSSQWVKVPFAEGGNTTVICMDSAGVIYVGTVLGEVYRSTNQGTSWINSSAGLNRSQINALAAGNDFILAATLGDGIFKSTNHGVSWFSSDNGIPDNSIYSLAIFGENILAGSTKVYRSKNKGENWSQTSNGIAFNHGVHSLTMNNDYCFASTSLGSSGTMYRSTNLGISWSVFNNGLPTFYVDKIIINGNDVLGLITTNYIYKTTNFGEYWFNLNIPSGGIYSLNASQGIIAAGGYDKFHISTNSGINWITYSNILNAGTFNDVLIQSSYFIAATSRGIYKTMNSGANWNPINSGFYNVPVNSLLGGQSFVLLGTDLFGLYKTTNNGVNWNRVQSVAENSHIYSLKHNANYIYGLISSRLHRSSDNGENWTLIPAVNNDIVSKYDVKNNIIFVKTTASIFYSTNSGVNWINANGGLPSASITVNSFYIADTCCYASFASLSPTFTIGIYKFSYSNLTWLLVTNNGLSRRISAFNEHNNRTYAGAMDSGVFVSTNSGFSWVRKSSGLTNNENINGFVFSGDTIYASSQYRGIYRSTNAADSWSGYNDGLDSMRNFNCITGGPNMLFAGSQFGLWKRTAFVAVNSPGKNIPASFILHQNFPNPFNPVTIIKFEVPSRAFVKISIFDITGKLIKILVNEIKETGIHSVEFDGMNFASGIYIYRMETNNYSVSRKMIILK